MRRSMSDKECRDKLLCFPGPICKKPARQGLTGWDPGPIFPFVRSTARTLPQSNPRNIGS